MLIKKKTKKKKGEDILALGGKEKRERKGHLCFV
jgi:hypothetical protein